MLVICGLIRLRRMNSHPTVRKAALDAFSDALTEGKIDRSIGEL